MNIELSDIRTETFIRGGKEIGIISEKADNDEKHYNREDLMRFMNIKIEDNDIDFERKKHPNLGVGYKLIPDKYKNPMKFLSFHGKQYALFYGDGKKEKRIYLCDLSGFVRTKQKNCNKTGMTLRVSKPFRSKSSYYYDFGDDAKTVLDITNEVLNLQEVYSDPKGENLILHFVRYNRVNPSNLYSGFYRWKIGDIFASASASASLQNENCVVKLFELPYSYKRFNVIFTSVDVYHLSHDLSYLVVEDVNSFHLYDFEKGESFRNVIPYSLVGKSDIFEKRNFKFHGWKDDNRFYYVIPEDKYQPSENDKYYECDMRKLILELRLISEERITIGNRMRVSFDGRIIPNIDNFSVKIDKIRDDRTIDLVRVREQNLMRTIVNGVIREHPYCQELARFYEIGEKSAILGNSRWFMIGGDLMVCVRVIV